MLVAFRCNYRSCFHVEWNKQITNLLLRLWMKILILHKTPDALKIYHQGIRITEIIIINKNNFFIMLKWFLPHRCKICYCKMTRLKIWARYRWSFIRPIDYGEQNAFWGTRKGPWYAQNTVQHRTVYRSLTLTVISNLNA